MAIQEGISSTVNWLTGFENTKTYILNNDDVKFIVYRKRFEKGSEVVLGNTNTGQNYTVAILPPSNLAPAYDLKTDYYL